MRAGPERSGRAVYEFGQHTLIGRDCGLTDVKIGATAPDTCLDHRVWTDGDRDLIVMAADGGSVDVNIERAIHG